MEEADRKELFKIAKTAVILAVSALWLHMAVYSWQHWQSVYLYFPRGSYIDRLLLSLPEKNATASIQIYLYLAGFPLLAFYLTVLVPGLLEPVFRKNARSRLWYGVFSVPVLCFGFAAAYLGCGPGAAITGIGRSLAGARVAKGALAKTASLVNVNMTPVVLGLILLTWCLPRTVILIKELGENPSGIKRVFARRAGFYVILVAIAFVLIALSALLMAILRPLYPDAVYYVERFCRTNAFYLSSCLVSVVLAPLIEEVIFRGQIQYHLHKGMPFWAALVITSVFSDCGTEISDNSYTLS